MNQLNLGQFNIRWLILPISIVIFMVFLVFLVKRLSDSMKIAAQNNGRINQYLAAVPADRAVTISAVYQNTKKNTDTAMLLCIAGGTFGIQRAYLGRRRSAILMMLFFWTGVPAVISLFDLTGMPAVVSEFNLTVIRSLYDQIAAPNLEE